MTRFPGLRRLTKEEASAAVIGLWAGRHWPGCPEGTACWCRPAGKPFSRQSELFMRSLGLKEDDDE